MANLTVKQAFTKAFQMLRSNVITHITLADSTSLTPTDGLLNIPAATDANPGVMTVEHCNTLQSAQADATAALSKFKTLTISGKTDAYGKIAMPNTSYYPIASLSRDYTINGDHNGIRVLNTATDTAVLAKNATVNFNIIGMLRS